MFIPTQLSILFQWVKIRWPGWPNSFPHLYDFFKNLLWLCFRPGYNWNTTRWRLSNNQSINQIWHGGGFVAKMLSFKFKCPNYQTHIKVTVFMCPVSRSALKSALMIYLKDIPLSKCEIYFLQYQNKGLSWA